MYRKFAAAVPVSRVVVGGLIPELRPSPGKNPEFTLAAVKLSLMIVAPKTGVMMAAKVTLTICAQLENVFMVGPSERASRFSLEWRIVNLFGPGDENTRK